MKPIDFIRERRQVWLDLNHIVRHFDAFRLQTSQPDEAHNFLMLYRKTARDFSLCRTLFPRHALTTQLAGLCARARFIVEAGRRDEWGQMMRFLRRDLPQTLYQALLPIVFSFTVFLGAGLLGFGLQHLEPNLSSLILSDRYMDVTAHNIERGEPMAIYRDHGSSGDMMNLLMVNNIRVAALAFVAGICYGVGTFLVLFRNGIMLGSLAAYFHAYDLAVVFWSTVMLHGTLELSAIVIAGGAGMVLGKSLFFPGDRPRTASLGEGARKAMILMATTVPLFVIAAWVESHVTPVPNLEMERKLWTISLSIVFLILYYGLMFWLGFRNRRERPDEEAEEIRFRFH